MGDIGVLVRGPTIRTVAAMKTSRFVPLLATALICAGSTLYAAPAPPPKGIEISDLDRKADRCTDFDAFANGTWRAANPIPAGSERWNRRWAARAANRKQLTTMLEEFAAKTNLRAREEQQLGDTYAACLDDSAVEAEALAPFDRLFAAIEGIQDVAGVQRVIRRLHDLSIPAVFSFTGASDYHNPAMMVASIAAGGLGLPDRDDYLAQEEHSSQRRSRYRAHLVTILTLGGTAPDVAQKSADDILAFETRLAEASLSSAKAADPATTAHMVTFEQLEALTPRFDWEHYYAEAGLQRLDVNVAEPALLQRIDQELDATPVEVWKAYLKTRLVEWASPWLAKPFADESFEFTDKFLGGASERKPRAARCLELTESLLGEPMGREFAARYFTPAAKAKVEEIIGNLHSVLRDEVAEVAWMTPAAHEQALAKVTSYEVRVGYPGVWTDYSRLTIHRDTFWANVAAARRFNVDLNRKQIGQRLAREVWALPPSSPDAYIDIQNNVMFLPAGFLQSPVFDPSANDAANYGSLGASVAHDMTHAIDRLGADFDAAGQPRNWWADADRESFDRVGQCVVDQYNSYTVPPATHLQGKQILGEAVADLAGIQVAYQAFERTQKVHADSAIGGFSPEQQFFLAWAQFRGAEETPKQLKQMVASDTHAPGRYRVIGPLSSTAEFQKAFDCKAGSVMAMPEAKRCKIW
jgi:putative endopeptidase